MFLAGDHEYRSEESLPALARILAKHYGFKCSVFFTHRSRRPASSSRAARRSPGWRRLKTADLMVVFLRFQDFPDDADAAHRRLPRSRRTGGRVPHRDARVPDQATGCEVPEVPLAEQGRLRRRLRPADSGRNVGVALWHEPQAELAADPRALAGEPPDPARREGRLGAVGRLHRRSAAAERDPRARADPERDDARLAACARQAADAGRLGAHLHRRIREGPAASSRRPTARRRIC